MWKVLRVLGNLCGKDGFDHQSSADVRTELEALTGGRTPSAAYAGAHALALPAKQSGLGHRTMRQRKPTAERTLPEWTWPALRGGRPW